MDYYLVDTLPKLELYHRIKECLGQKGLERSKVQPPNIFIFNLLGWNFSVYEIKTPFGWVGEPHSRVRESNVGLVIFKKEGEPGTFKKNTE